MKCAENFMVFGICKDLSAKEKIKLLVRLCLACIKSLTFPKQCAKLQSMRFITKSKYAPDNHNPYPLNLS